MSPPPHPPHRPPPPQQPPHHPPQPHYYYPYPPPYHRRKRTSNTFSSCILATAFLIILAVATTITLFILFRPQDPIISTTTMKFLSFSLLNNSANFTFLQSLSIRNPNRFSFSHYDSSIQLSSSSAGPIGLIYIPAGQIAGGHTQLVSATFEVKSAPTGTDTGSVVGPGPTMELETTVKLVGSVKVLKVFAHHVEKASKCRVSVQLSDGSVLGYHC